VYAQRSRFDRQFNSVDTSDCFPLHQLNPSRYGFTDILDHGAGVTSRHEKSIGPIGPVRERFTREPDSGFLGGRLHLAVRESEEHQCVVDFRYRIDHRTGRIPLARGAVVQRAVRLDVAEAGPLR